MSRTAVDRLAVDRPIVVGADGSPESITALRWAARQAHLTGAQLVVVNAWQRPVRYGQGGPGFGYGAPIDLDFEGDASKLLAELVNEVSTDELADVRIEQVVREGSPVSVLLDQAKSASLLVVGNRGRGAFTGMLLGSVSGHCVSHAACPVVVVRGEEDA